MRVLLDTNILVSYLLQPRDPIRLIVDAALAGAYELLIPEAMLDELSETISRKERLRERIPPDLMAEFIREMEDAAIEVALEDLEIPPITRDPKDDYLIAYAIAGQADILVSGDKDLLVLGRVGKINFLSPADFARLLEVNP